jgi:Rrf2 family protein
MARIFSISEAASIGIHSMVLIAQAKKGINAVKIAEITGLSKNHISKVLQRLVKADMLKSTRGPSGGFSLKKSPEQISLLDVYETIEGAVEITNCPFAHDICGFENCIMGTVMNKMNLEFRKFLGDQTLNKYL